MYASIDLADGPSHSTEEWDHMMQRLNEEAKKVTEQYEKRCTGEVGNYGFKWFANLK